MIIEDLLVESLVYGGQGLGHHQGKVVFVPYTAPGDRVRCRVLRERKRYVEAAVEKVLSPASDRRIPPCPVFGECGGCQWQHLPYTEQTRWKESVFRSTLERQVGIERDRIKSIAAAPQEWNYRSRAQIKARMTPKGLVMGFFRRGSHYVAATDRCPILHPKLNEAWALFRDWLQESPDPGHVPQIDLEVDDFASTRAVVHYIGRYAGQMKAHFRSRGQDSGLALFLQSGRKNTLEPLFGQEELIIQVDTPPVNLRYGAGGFAQINLDQNRAMVREMVALLTDKGHWRVLDLFCGMGNFSLPAARHVAKVIGVENYAPAISQARNNALDNRLSNVEFHAMPAAGAATRFAADGELDLVILDPPRSGAYDVVKELIGVQPSRIMYISCDPQTLARDLVPLVHGGYRVQWSRPFDLFPQTHHMESITFLSKECG